MKDPLPNVLTELSIPDGLPWIIFSPSKAHLLINSRSFSTNTDQPRWLKSGVTESDNASRAAEIETQNEADEPKPEPSGSSEVTTTVAGLNLRHKEPNKKSEQ